MKIIYKAFLKPKSWNIKHFKNEIGINYRKLRKESKYHQAIPINNKKYKFKMYKHQVSLSVS